MLRIDFDLSELCGLCQYFPGRFCYHPFHQPEAKSFKARAQWASVITICRMHKLGLSSFGEYAAPCALAQLPVVVKATSKMSMLMFKIAQPTSRNRQRQVLLTAFMLRQRTHFQCWHFTVNAHINARMGPDPRSCHSSYFSWGFWRPCLDYRRDSG